PAVARGITVTSRSMLLVSAVAYLMAFMPPAALRRQWSGGAAYGAVRRALYSDDQTPAAVWRGYAESVRHIAIADAVAVIASEPDGTVVELTAAGLLPAGTAHRRDDL